MILNTLRDEKDPYKELWNILAPQIEAMEQGEFSQESFDEIIAEVKQEKRI